MVAAFVMAVTFAVHLFVGGPELYTPLRSSDLSPLEKSSFSVIWHFVSVHLCMSAVALFYLARHRNPAFFAFTLASVSSFALLFFGYGLVDLGSVWLMPQWIAFVVVGTLMGLSLFRAHS